MKVSVGEACLSEVARSNETRNNYEREINMFLGYCECSLEDIVRGTRFNRRLEEKNCSRRSGPGKSESIRLS